MVDIPQYTVFSGRLSSVGSLNASDLRLRIDGISFDECFAYVKRLIASGFVLCTHRTILVGKGKKHLFYTFVKEDMCLHLFRNAVTETVILTVEPLCFLPDSEPIPGPQEGLSPTVTQFSLRNGGMSYAVQLADGSFLLVDGGEYDESDVETLYNFLKGHTVSEKPTVAMWFFTHSHNDHIRLAMRFFRDYHKKVDVRAFVYQFPDCEKVTVLKESAEYMKGEIEQFEGDLKYGYPHAAVYTLHTGQVYHVCGAEMEILYSMDDTYPQSYNSFNDMSAALRLKFENGRTVLFLGDCMRDACSRILETYGSYLKSDLMQVTHHGLIGGSTELYKYVDPEICFWPVSEARFFGTYTEEAHHWCLGEGGCDYNAFLRDDSIRKRVHYPAGTVTTVFI